MKIILMEDIKKKGKKGDILNVKDGYGTFLINSKKAVLASSININKLDKYNEKRKQDLKLEIEKCKQIRSKIEKEVIKISVKTGVDNKVFGSVSSKQIAEILNNRGYSIEKKNIKIDNPLTSLGYHVVNIILHKEVIAKINVQLVK